MKINDLGDNILEGALSDLYGQWKQSKAQNNATKQAQQNYSKALDDFANELQTKEEKDEFQQLRDIYNAKPNALAVRQLHNFILDKQSYMDTAAKQKAALAAQGTANAYNTMVGPQPTAPKASTVQPTAKLNSEVKVLSTDPAILQYDNRRYFIDNGKWVTDSKRGVLQAPTSISRFLTQQLEIAKGDADIPEPEPAMPAVFRRKIRTPATPATAPAAATATPAVFRSKRLKQPAAPKPKYKPNPAGGAPIRIGENKNLSDLLWNKMTQKRSPFRWQLVEGKEGKNLHLEHLEDLVFNEGYLGAKRALNYCENLRQMLNTGQGDKAKITVKWDGAPAIICGIDPADSKFFVGTKSVFSKNDPKICKTEKDIKKFYGEQAGLASKLSAALKYLRKLGIGNVLQGDLMFTPGDVQNVKIGNEDYLAFQPNTITYAVKVNSELGQRIANAKIGIIFHTAYSGVSLLEMQASFGAEVAGLNQSKDVWFDDATYKDYTGIASLTPEENARISRTLGQSALTLKKINPKKFDIILGNPEFANYIKPFINSMVKSGEQIGDPVGFLNQFLAFYKGKQEAEISKLKGGVESAAAKQRIEKIKKNEEFIEDNSNTLLGILAIYKRIIELKLMILGKLQRIESIGTFIKTNTGYKVTTPEGFVAIGHDGGAVKLVDRLEFSRQNFTATKNWSKD